VYILLSESDRERLGCDERLPLELTDITAREQATLQKAFGYHTVEDVVAAHRAMWDFDSEGKTAGGRRDPQLLLAFSWLALRQSGLFTARRAEDMAVELADLDVQLLHVQLDYSDGPSEGKAEGSTPTRTSSD
jgi:hypothetical protein